MPIGPNGVEVQGARCPTDLSRYGLLSVVDPLPNVDPHFGVGGIMWEDFLCTSGVEAFIEECPPASGFTKPAERNFKFCQADPFLLVGSYKCPPVGRPADQAFEIARQRLLKWEGRQLERTLWTGEVLNGAGFINPSFAYGNSECDIVPVDVHAAGAVDPVKAIALLEEALGDTVGTCGLIHVPYRLAAYIHALYILELLDGKWFTPTGYQVVFGQGYPGTGPANVPAAAGEAWIFATGPLVLAMSDMMQVPENVQEGFNRMINDVEIRAERFYSVGFSCALLAVKTLMTGIF